MKKQEVELLDKITAGYSLPAMSPLAMRLIRLASIDDISIEDLSSVIEKDPSLTIRLLRLANSAFFRTGGPITTIGQAIQMIGLNRLRIMALSLSLRDTFPMGRVGALDYEEFWKISLYQALLAKSLGQRLRTCKPDEAFVGGLILEIGLLIFFDLFVKKDRNVERIRLQPLAPLLKWEEERYGLNHRQVGEATLKYWKFPKEIIECQGHYLVETDPSEVPGLAFVCNMAGVFSAIICEESTEWHPLFEKAEKTYGMDHDMLADILVSALDDVREVAISLKVEMNRKQDILGIMEKANRALSAISERMLQINEADSKFAMPTFSGFSSRGTPAREALQAIVHEVRNPLTAIGGFARKLEKNLDPASEEWEYVRVIVEEATKLETRLDELERKERQ
ncbi:MAG TPA: HDOD domain-containing protein [Dissulfurispiraceae bacterium]|nr:HDOD domain-containing protein [Dissulfurispiraceae bacterium]